MDSGIYNDNGISKEHYKKPAGTAHPSVEIQTIHKHRTNERHKGKLDLVWSVSQLLLTSIAATKVASTAWFEEAISRFGFFAAVQFALLLHGAKWAWRMNTFMKQKELLELACFATTNFHGQLEGIVSGLPSPLLYRVDLKSPDSPLHALFLRVTENINERHPRGIYAQAESLLNGYPPIEEATQKSICVEIEIFVEGDSRAIASYTTHVATQSPTPEIMYIFEKHKKALEPFGLDVHQKCTYVQRGG